ncbi:chlorite dismutase family protein [Bacillus sp. DX1.1]|uniref:chlorite dismutase family protein n=1 Tax=unclassified Bacillus (in: firmicutes) TaxID=185979 RepID=UPI00256FB96B|nr:MULTISPECIES: chlorite dismutase family protein [unclassified Bacillus (in: firmicutes)]MDM5157258.1 chlorite dismutase family protein [Bacillus sp. DX1.1]WJE81485.1 chlorite dismutase family protein [Bacillus sp. DX3.1]
MVVQFTNHLALKYTPRWNELAEQEKKAAIKEVVGLFAKYEGKVWLRGTYVTQAFQAHTDILLWMYADRFEDIQDLQLELRRSTFGKAVDSPYAFTGMTKPFEFSEHPTSFQMGIPPRDYLCFYPFIRTPEYYLLPKWEREALLRDHGLVGHAFVPGILTNAVHAFGLGDYEWLLSFETDDLGSLVDCVRSLRDCKARLYTKHEWPFIVGRHFTLEEALSQYI